MSNDPYHYGTYFDSAASASGGGYYPSSQGNSNGGLIYGLINTAVQGISSAVQNRRNRQSVDKQWERALEMWHMQNAYNHPTEQMKRLRDAGLNPNLVYGGFSGGVAGNASAQAKPGAERYERIDVDALKYMGQYWQNQSAKVSIDNQRKQGDNIIADTALKGVTTANKMLEGRVKKVDAELAEELKSTSADAARQALELQKAQTIGAQLENDFKDETLRARIQGAIDQAAIIGKTLQRQDAINAVQKMAGELARWGLSPNDPWYIRIMGIAAEGIENLTLQDLWKYIKPELGMNGRLINPFR